jgi:hypothetical protein
MENRNKKSLNFRSVNERNDTEESDENEATKAAKELENKLKYDKTCVIEGELIFKSHL